MDEDMKVRDTESWKSCNLVDSVIDLSTVGTPCTENPSRSQEPEGRQVYPFGLGLKHGKAYPLDDIGSVQKNVPRCCKSNPCWALYVAPRVHGYKGQKDKRREGKAIPEACTSQVARGPHSRCCCQGTEATTEMYRQHGKWKRYGYCSQDGHWAKIY